MEKNGPKRQERARKRPTRTSSGHRFGLIKSPVDAPPHAKVDALAKPHAADDNNNINAEPQPAAKGTNASEEEVCDNVIFHSDGEY